MQSTTIPADSREGTQTSRYRRYSHLYNRSRTDSWPDNKGRSGEQVREFLDGRDTGFLQSQKAIFIADISRLPVTLRNLSVLPRLRKNRYPIVLIYESKMSRSFSNPKKRNRIAVATLRNRIVQKVEYVSTVAELRNVFQNSIQERATQIN